MTAPTTPTGRHIGTHPHGSDAWLAARSGGLGGSEVAAVVGLARIPRHRPCPQDSSVLPGHPRVGFAYQSVTPGSVAITTSQTGAASGAGNTTTPLTARRIDYTDRSTAVMQRTQTHAVCPGHPGGTA